MEPWGLFFKNISTLFTLLLFFIFFSGNDRYFIFSAQLNRLHTVGILTEGHTRLELFQRIYAAKGEWIFQREQSIFLQITHWMEFGIHLPHLNYINQQGSTQTRFGDAKISLNLATDWFIEHLAVNYYIEYNTGSGPKYTNLSTHPLEGYGYEEWRTGLIVGKSLAALPVTLHLNLFYVFRGESEPTLFGSFLNEKTLNIFAEEAYRRGLGFNPAHSSTFFYHKNFPNDNIELNIAINTDVFYPLVPFMELATNFMFTQNFAIKGIGSGIMRNQISFGSKLFFSFDAFSLKLTFMLPLSPLNELYLLGMGLGFSLEF